MSSELFAGMPSINIPRSKWKAPYNITTSFKHGFLVPIDAIPVIAGDSVKLTMRDLTRLQTPIAPIFGNIKQHFGAFFVPLRLLWTHGEEFFGANKTSAGYQQTVYELPHAKFGSIAVGSLSHYLGKPVKDSTETDGDGNAYIIANILKERAYFLIWNEYFRAQQVTNPVLLDMSDATDSDFVTNKIGTYNGNNIHPGLSTSLMKVAKQFDYFTASTISPQYGASVTLPLGTVAPIIGDGRNFHDLSSVADTDLRVITANTGQTNGSYIDTTTGNELSIAETGIHIDKINWVADLSNATAAKINDIRYAFAVQKYLERANFSGNYFFGILQVHYGVTSPDSRLQRPEFLGEFSQDILVHQVTATADTVNSGVKTSVGSTGAVSVTASGNINLFDKAFVEPGYIVLLRWCRHRQVYSQGIMREDMKKDRFEVYTPELCNLGDQSTMSKEIYWKAKAKTVFGYQEHWAEYRYRPDRVSGMLDPAGGATQLKFWTLANEFTSEPQLDDTFISEQRDCLDRALVTGSSYDEYVSDTWIELTLTREMPVRTMPGLIDHFGAM